MQEEGRDFTGISFDVGQCDVCEREVLTYPAYEGEAEVICCVHCDARVTNGLRTALGEDLPDFGYGLLELQGCGNPECGGGRCSRMADEEAG